jgi:tetratricopeptide (TPR) repeat protein
MKPKPQVKRTDTPQAGRWPFLAAAAAAFVVAVWAYGPALHGEFLFDDNGLSFTLPGATAPLSTWIHGVRPVLQFSYWLNSQLSGDDPFSYHVVNLLLHCMTSGLIFLIVRRLLAWSGVEKARQSLLAGLAALLFLLHPVQTEAVAYLAGRSDGLSTLFAAAALTIFLYRKETSATWIVVVEVLAFFGLALLSKEQTVALPALLLLTDFWWNPGFSLRGIFGNWRLYVVMALGAAGGVAYFWNLIFGATTAGFAMKDFRWYQYFFTQCRALFVYIREFLFPVNLNADWDFPLSRTILDHGAIAGLIALLALAAAAWHFRRRFPLACYGFFTYLILIAPTSSILPIQDTVAERRLYFPMLGLLLIVVDLVSRIKIDRRQLACASAVLLLAEAFATHARAAVWTDPLTLWQDAAQKSPNKFRVRFQLAFAYYARQDYATAIQKFADAAQVGPPRADLLLDWGLAYNSLHETEKALEKLREAAAVSTDDHATAHIYSQIGQVYGGASRWPEALTALNQAEKLDPNLALTFFYRGLVYYNTRECAKAVQDYQRALALDPTLPDGNVALRQAAACAAAH